MNWMFEEVNYYLNNWFWELIQLLVLRSFFLFLFSLSLFRSPLSGRAFTLYSFFLHYPDRTLVHYLSLHLSMCPISHLLWLSVNGGGWNCTVQRSSPHKFDQKSCCNAFNAVVAAFASRYFCILIIFACAQSSSLSLGPLGGSPRLPKYLLDRYSLYSRSIDSSDYIPSSFLYVILHSEHLLLICSSSDVSMFRNRVQGPLYQFGLLPPQPILCNKPKTQISCASKKISDAKLALDLALEVAKINTHFVQREEAMKKSKELLFIELC